MLLVVTVIVALSRKHCKHLSFRSNNGISPSKYLPTYLLGTCRELWKQISTSKRGDCFPRLHLVLPFSLYSTIQSRAERPFCIYAVFGFFWRYLRSRAKGIVLFSQVVNFTWFVVMKMNRFWWMFLLFAKTGSASDNELPSADPEKGRF